MTAVEQMAQCRSDIEELERLAVEADYEYTSKARLRTLAQAGIGSLLEQRRQVLHALAQLEEQDSAAPSGLIVAPEGAPKEGLITL